jgi:hypothetical protein
MTDKTIAVDDIELDMSPMTVRELITLDRSGRVERVFTVVANRVMSSEGGWDELRSLTVSDFRRLVNRLWKAFEETEDEAWGDETGWTKLMGEDA